MTPITPVSTPTPQGAAPLKRFKEIIKRSLRLSCHAATLAATFSSIASEPQEKTVPFAESIEDLPLAQLEPLRNAVTAELNQLANFNLRGGIGSICFRSMPQAHERAAQWVQINLDREYPIDEIALIPAIWRDNENGYRSDGFPRQFRILAGNDANDQEQLIAEITTDETILPRIAPLTIPCADLNASWIKIQADLLSTRFHDGAYILQFAEAMIFSNGENVALNQTVTASSDQRTGTGAYKREYLVDGFLPYIMDGAEGQKSNPYLSGFFPEDQASLTIDLESQVEVTKLRIHTIEQGDTVPHALEPNFALPKHLIVEGASDADFLDAETLWNYQPKDSFDIAPIISKRLPAKSFRYIRFRTPEPFLYDGFDNHGIRLFGKRIGFAELEIYAGIENRALGKTFNSSYNNSIDDPDRPLSRLTDGHNIFGEILNEKEWMTQLARRHVLEFQLPLIEQAIQSRYGDQKAKLRLWVGIAVLLAIIAIIIFLTDRILRQRAIFRTRERIAADLHDELGANLHAIALLGDLALAAKDSPQKSSDHIERIRALVRRTGKAVKHCTNMLDTPGLYQNLHTEMKQISLRLMADLDHKLTVEGQDNLPKIRPRKRVDLFLFYKESLINILRHSKATIVRSKLELSESRLTLTIRDNGQGIPNTSADAEPPSLKRRARLVGGKLTVSKGDEGGTSVILQMNL